MNEQLINYFRERGIEPTAKDVEFFNRLVACEIVNIADYTENKETKEFLGTVAEKYRKYKYEPHKNALPVF